MLTSKRFDADVVVCGGGPAGFASALAAARDGKRTILLEMRESLGGLYTNGYITGMAGYVDGYAKEFIDRMDKAGHAMVRPHLPSRRPCSSPPSSSCCWRQAFSPTGWAAAASWRRPSAAATMTW